VNPFCCIYFEEGINQRLPRAKRKGGDAMDIIVEYLRNPIICGIIIAAGTVMTILALRTRSVFTPEQQKLRETCWVLLGGLVIYLLINGWVMLTPSRAPLRITRHLETNVSPIATPTLFATQVVTPTQAPSPTATVAPSPTPTPVLSRSITQVLTSFCDAITSREYQTAWNQYALSLQQRHSQTEVIAVWRHFTRCHFPDQDGDPSAWTLLTISMENGYVDQYGFVDQASYRFTMTVENDAWKVAKVCHHIAEGCYEISWG
jgi:hypothetical protein